MNGYQQVIIEALGRYDDSYADSDPVGEHEFRMITVQGHQILFKIDYFDRKPFRDPRATSDTKDVHGTVNVMLANGHERVFLLGIQIDGVHMDEDMTLVAAGGVDVSGDKHPLGLVNAG